MNGMNRTIVGVVYGIALTYAVLCLVMSLIWLFDTGAASLVLFLPVEGFGFDLGTPTGGIYDTLLSWLTSLMSLPDETARYVKLLLIVVGFIVPVLGMVSRPALDVEGGGNPAEYLWTHRPKAFARCVTSPFGLFQACTAKHKALVVVPVILLPLYVWWALLLAVALVVPFLLVRAVIGMRIKSAAKREEAEYTRTTQYAVCPKCKRNFLRPKVRCKCGLELEYPVPNEHGYRYHTCNKGHDIPCVSGKRGSLRTVCPYCSADIETREAMPISIAMVGAVGSGKTTMMLAAVKSITAMARTRDIVVEAVSPGVSKDAVAAKDVVARTPPGEMDSECLFIRSRALQDREIIFNDVSGQEFEPREDKILFEEYFTYSDGIVFAFDPVALKRQGRTATPMEVFESFHYMFTQINGTSPSKVSSVPFAIVATRNDVMGPALTDDAVRDYLRDNGQGDFVRVAESLFSDVAYFAVNSTGDDCMSAARPVWWIVRRCDRELADAVPVE
ncbi:MAG: hypothetical protein IJ026_02120 [Candidatus Methanomethylophilaceae archaeon]|nr:hypothetical protein [Candidatus Methanomethylophilaceae archaeon]